MADAGTGLTNSQLPQFNGKNHNDWSIKMKALFASQGIWELVDTGYVEPADATALAALTTTERDQLKSDKKKNAKALFLLFQSVHESIFPRIPAATKSKEAWDTLKTAYQGMEKVKTAKLQMLRRDFETLSMKESDTIDSFFTQVIGLITQIRSHGEILEERRIVEKILRCLPSMFEAVVIPLLSKHSRLRCLSAKEEAEGEQITEVVEEAKTEADIILQAQSEGAAIRTKMKVQANSKLMDKGMTNPKSNVIIVRNMGTMQMNVGKNKMT
eukprot:PITA_22594